MELNFYKEHIQNNHKVSGQGLISLGCFEVKLAITLPGALFVF